MLKVATPFETTPTPSEAAPSRKVTVPVALLEDTVALKVTVCSNFDGFGLELSVTVAPAVLTFWVRLAELPAKLLSAEYVAVIECAPPLNEEVAKLALPPVSGATARTASPSLKVTLPLAPAGPTVAVNVTDCPKSEGSTLEVKPVELAARFTVCVNAAALPAKLPSPEYVAVIECPPPVSAEVLKLAPPEIRGTTERTVAPSLKLTVPVTPAGPTVAVKVTD